MSDICKFELFLKKRCYNAYLLTGIERLILRGIRKTDRMISWVKIQ